MRAAQFADEVIALGSAALEVVLRTVESGRAVPMRLEELIEVQPLGPYGRAYSKSKSFRPVRDYDGLFNSAHDWIIGQSGLHELAATVLDSELRDHVLPNVGADVAAEMIVQRYVRPIVTECLAKGVRPPPTREDVEPLVRQLIAIATREQFPVTFWAPLADLSSPLKAAQLCNEVIIRELTQEEKNELWQREDQGEVPMWHADSMTHALETSYSVPNFHGVDAGEADKRFRKAVTAMRLLKAGSVSCYLTIHRASEPNSFHPCGGSGWRDPPASSGPSYQLLDSDLASVGELYEKLSTPHFGTVRLALHRLNQGIERQKADDRLIDYWIGVEALFSPSQEITHRISLRVAYWIGQSPDERERIYQVCVDSYGLRSDVVHGRSFERAQTSKLKLDAKAALDLTEEYLRKALRRAVIDGVAPDGQQLDIAIARGETP